MAIGENILKHWKWYAIVTALISIVGWAYTQGSMNKETENRLFTTEKMRYETERYMEKKPSPKQEQQAYFRDSANKASAIKSRKMRDSVYLVETKARRKTDSIVALNADQLYQIKEQLKRIGN